MARETFHPHDVDLAKWIALQFDTRPRAMALRVVARRLAGERDWAAGRLRARAVEERRGGETRAAAVLEEIADNVVSRGPPVEERAAQDEERGEGRGS